MPTPSNPSAAANPHGTDALRRKRRARLAVLGMLLHLALVGCASLPPSGQVAVGGEPVSYAHLGQGTPTLVFQSGLGDGRSTWNGLMQDLQGTHSVFAYDRPGYGRSAATARPRDPCTVAREEHALLQAAGVPPPYVLVGHSLGGLYQYAFARLYPNEVAGLVLLDPTHPRHLETLKRDAPSSASLMLTLRATLFGATTGAEFDQMAACLEPLDTTRPLGMPVRLLVSTRFQSIEDARFQAALWPMREDWRRLTGAGALTRVAAGHYIHRDAPADVVAAIRSVMPDRTANAALRTAAAP